MRGAAKTIDTIIYGVIALPDGIFELDFFSINKSPPYRNSSSIDKPRRDLSNSTAIGVMSTIVVEKNGRCDNTGNTALSFTGYIFCIYIAAR